MHAKQLMRDVKLQILHQPPLPLPPQHRTGQTSDGARLLHNLLSNLPGPRQQPVERQHLVDQSHQLLERQPLAVPGYQVKLKMRIEQLRVLRAQGNVA